MTSSAIAMADSELFHRTNPKIAMDNPIANAASRGRAKWKTVAASATPPKNLHLVEIDHDPPQSARGARQAGRAGDLQERRLDQAVAEIEPIAERSKAEHHKQVGLARARQKWAHAKCCHAFPRRGNRPLAVRASF
jgi:hypothetical protein